MSTICDRPNYTSDFVATILNLTLPPQSYSIDINSMLMLDPENVCVAVEFSLLTCLNAEISLRPVLSPPSWISHFWKFRSRTWTARWPNSCRVRHYGNYIIVPLAQISAWRYFWLAKIALIISETVRDTGKYRLSAWVNLSESDNMN